MPFADAPGLVPWLTNVASRRMAAAANARRSSPESAAGLESADTAAAGLLQLWRLKDWGSRGMAAASAVASSFARAAAHLCRDLTCKQHYTLQV